MTSQLAEGYCDLVMSGVAITTERARELLLSDSYLDETVALVVPDHERDRFATWQEIRDRAPLTIAAPDVPYYVRKLHELLPRAVITTQQDIGTWFAGHDAGVDALALPAERGSAWTLRYPAYSVVVPGPDPIRVPLAYPIGKRDAALARYVNTWIALKRKDGTFDAAYRHWILGHDATPDRPRWSIVRDVLHWMK
jgi:ABC-type amino acid transport substrate-binding protein